MNINKQEKTVTSPKALLKSNKSFEERLRAFTKKFFHKNEEYVEIGKFRTTKIEQNKIVKTPKDIKDEHGVVRRKIVEILKETPTVSSSHIGGTARSMMTKFNKFDYTDSVCVFSTLLQTTGGRKEILNWFDHHAHEGFKQIELHSMIIFLDCCIRKSSFVREDFSSNGELTDQAANQYVLMFKNSEAFINAFQSMFLTISEQLLSLFEQTQNKQQDEQLYNVYGTISSQYTFSQIYDGLGDKFGYIYNYFSEFLDRNESLVFSKTKQDFLDTMERNASNIVDKDINANNLYIFALKHNLIQLDTTPLERDQNYSNSLTSYPSDDVKRIQLLSSHKIDSYARKYSLLKPIVEGHGKKKGGVKSQVASIASYVDKFLNTSNGNTETKISLFYNDKKVVKIDDKFGSEPGSGLSLMDKPSGSRSKYFWLIGTDFKGVIPNPNLYVNPDNINEEQKILALASVVVYTEKTKDKATQLLNILTSELKRIGSNKNLDSSPSNDLVDNKSGRGKSTLAFPTTNNTSQHHQSIPHHQHTVNFGETVGSHQQYHVKQDNHHPIAPNLSSTGELGSNDTRARDVYQQSLHPPHSYHTLTKSETHNNDNYVGSLEGVETLEEL